MTERVHKRRPRLKRILLTGLMMIGIGIVLTPLISYLVAAQQQGFAIDAYQQQVGRLQPQSVTRARADARVYNQQLQDRGFNVFAAGSGYASQLNVGGIMGRVKIPSIHVDLPIYHGVGEDALQKGVGHLPGSALPIGGAGTHCVLTGHRGLPSSELLSDLDKLQLGDRFYLMVLDQVLAYQVDKISTVIPTDVALLKPEQGKDYCTLMTCTPYGINSHRLLVRGTRVQESPQEALEAVNQPTHITASPGFWRPLILLGTIAAAIAIVILVRRLVRRRTKGGTI